MIAIYVIAVVLVLAVGVALYKKSQTEKAIETERLRKIAEEEERQRKIALEEEAKKAARKAESEAGKEIYHFLNQSIKTMFYHYRTQQWDDLATLGEIELRDKEAASRCIEKLTPGSRKLVKDFFHCLDFDTTFTGEGKVMDGEALKKVFEDVMLPFFPVYYREFSSGPRYISFLNQRILKVFTQLSGKKFRLGYKNRYQNGQTAFEWTDDIYRVYRMDGVQLCEASFEDGRIKDGYAILKQDIQSDEEWDVYQKAVWKEGYIVSEDLQYIYTIPVC